MITVVGASGRVGRHVAALLGAGGARLGARRGDGTIHADTADQASLDRLCAGSALVINCTGPVAGTREPVLAAAARAGADYLDSGPAAEASARAGQRVVLAAGAAPGLSELLLRRLAAGMRHRPVRFSGYAATWDTISPAAAADLLAGLHRAAVAAAGPPQRDVPFFPGELVGHPVLRPEIVRAAGGADISWYEMFEPGSPVLAALAAARLPGAGTAGITAAATAVMAGREPYQQFLVEATGADGTGEVAVVRAGSTYRLTAAMLVAAAGAILAGRVPPGVHEAALALPVDCLDTAVRQAGDATLTVVGGRLADYRVYEAGTV